VIARTGDAARAWAATGGRVDPYGPAELPLVRHAVTLVASDLARLAGREADARRLACEAWEVARAAGLRVLHPILDTELLARSARAAVEDGRAGDAALDALRARDPRAAQALLRELAGHRAPAVRIRALQEIARWGDRAFHAETSAAQRDLDRRVRRAAADALARLDPHPRHGLRVETLGRFRALRGGEEIPEAEWRGVTTRRLLLRLLAGGGRPVGRERLLEDLWPETEPETARTHLRVALSRLNEVLEPERPPGAPAHFLVSDGDTLAWNRASELRWDAAEWEAAVASLPVPSPSDAASLLAARERFEAYGGPLVPELGADAWLDAIRLRLHERQAALGHRLAGALLARGDLEGCDAVAGRLAELDPADESAQALRARVRLRRGDRVAALRLLEQAAAELRRALDVEPGPELTELMATARKGTPAGPKRGSQSS
jgi:DNA-binding SARP family transcriptional activator